MRFLLTRRQPRAVARFVLTALIALVLSGMVTSAVLMMCGTERWSVKTGTDADVGLVDQSTTWPETVTDMGNWPRPGSLPSNNRIAPYETTVFLVSATLTEYKMESDEDYHLVLVDDNGGTMIAEIPAPHCVAASSPFKDAITNARAQFDAVFHVTTSFQLTNTPVLVTGVAFFDYNHGQTGAAPNFIELHPVLDIQFP
jgi:hypothetical protein